MRIKLPLHVTVTANAVGLDNSLNTLWPLVIVRMDMTAGMNDQKKMTRGSSWRSVILMTPPRTNTSRQLTAIAARSWRQLAISRLSSTSSVCNLFRSLTTVSLSPPSSMSFCEGIVRKGAKTCCPRERIGMYASERWTLRVGNVMYRYYTVEKFRFSLKSPPPHVPRKLLCL